jgi:hypothetical protein
VLRNHAKKIVKNRGWAEWFMLVVIPATWQAEIRRITFLIQCRQKVSENWAGDMAQMVDCLPSNYKALRSNPNTTK